jgi:hypothetical protein
MELNENVNLKNASDFLTNEIKEISESWTRTKLGLIALDKNIAIEPKPTDEENEAYERVTAALEGKKDKKKDFYIKNLPEKDKLGYERVTKERNKIQSGINMKENLKQYEEFLEVANEFKKEIDEKIN